MRITIDIPDEIHATLKALARNEGTTMRAIILSGLEAVLQEGRSPAKAEPSGSGEKQRVSGH